MSQDILMVANPSQYTKQPLSTQMQWLSAVDFWQQEELVKVHDSVLWQSFNTHGKYQRVVQHATWFAVATNEDGHYIASAFVIEVGRKWLIEYVMTDPAKQGKGVGSAIMNRIMTEAKIQQIEWVILNCDPDKNNGQLPAFYSKFGFKQVT
ncbi:MAG: GNAT family N-acetyltransferase [Candidatus Andersenbacteria bacterium]